MEKLFHSIAQLVEHHTDEITTKKAKMKLQNMHDYQLALSIEKEFEELVRELEIKFLSVLTKDLADLRKTLLDSFQEVFNIAGSKRNLEVTCRFRPKNRCSTGIFGLCSPSVLNECALDEKQLEKFLKLYATLVCYQNTEKNDRETREHLTTIMEFIGSEEIPSNEKICNYLRSKKYVLLNDFSSNENDLLALIEIAFGLFESEGGLDTLEAYRRLKEDVSENPYNPIRWLSGIFGVFAELTQRYSLKQKTIIELLKVLFWYMVISYGVSKVYQIWLSVHGFHAPVNLIPQTIIDYRNALPDVVQPYLGITFDDLAQKVGVDVGQIGRPQLLGITQEQTDIMRQVYKSLGAQATQEKILNTYVSISSAPDPRAALEALNPPELLTAGGSGTLAISDPRKTTDNPLEDIAPVLVGTYNYLVRKFNVWEEKQWLSWLSSFFNTTEYILYNSVNIFFLARAVYLSLNDIIYQTAKIITDSAKTVTKGTWNLTIGRIIPRFQIRKIQTENEKLDQQLLRLTTNISQQTQNQLKEKWEKVLNKKPGLPT